jgi:hypothetical protein
MHVKLHFQTDQEERSAEEETEDQRSCEVSVRVNGRIWRLNRIQHRQRLQRKRGTYKVHCKTENIDIYGTNKCTEKKERKSKTKQVMKALESEQSSILLTNAARHAQCVDTPSESTNQ